MRRGKDAGVGFRLGSSGAGSAGVGARESEGGRGDELGSFGVGYNEEKGEGCGGSAGSALAEGGAGVGEGGASLGWAEGGGLSMGDRQKLPISRTRLKSSLWGYLARLAFRIFLGI